MKKRHADLSRRSVTRNNNLLCNVGERNETECSQPRLSQPIALELNVGQQLPMCRQDSSVTSCLAHGASTWQQKRAKLGDRDSKVDRTLISHWPDQVEQSRSPKERPEAECPAAPNAKCHLTQSSQLRLRSSHSLVGLGTPSFGRVTVDPGKWPSK